MEIISMLILVLVVILVVVLVILEGVAILAYGTPINVDTKEFMGLSEEQYRLNIYSDEILIIENHIGNHRESFAKVAIPIFFKYFSLGRNNGIIHRWHPLSKELDKYYSKAKQ